MIDWTEKYRPKSLHEIVGNHSQLQKLERWAESWKKGSPIKKAIVLSGKPGIGKTSAAYALAHDYNWLPIELNASDARNATTINAVATAGATHQTFSNTGEFVSTKTGGRKLIIIDEADNLFERAKDSSVNGKDFGDRDGKKTIVKTVKVTSQPIVLIVNDDYQLFKGSGASLRKDCLHLKMYTAKSPEIIQLLKRICIQENVGVENQVLYSISESCEGDIRSAVRDLQSVCANKQTVRKDDADVLGRRDRSQLIFNVLQDIFQTKDIAVIQRNVQLVQEDPRMMLLWVAENLPNSYTSIEDIASAYQWLSKSDLYLGRTYNRNYYGLWSYACDLSTVAVSLAKKGRVKRSRYHFPSWLKMTSKKKNVLSAQQSILEKLSSYHHCSLKKAQSFIYPKLRKMIDADEELLHSLMKQLELTDEEVVALAGRKGKRILDKKMNDKKELNSIQKKVSTKKSGSKNEKKQTKEKSDSLKQQSLGSF